MMGLCRVLVYIPPARRAGAATGHVSAVRGSSSAYLIGLTYVAKQETLERGQEPLAARFLAAPLSLRFEVSPGRGGVASMLLAFVGWTGVARNHSKRRRAATCRAP